MNLKEHNLVELELHESQAREGVQCLLHSILFVRAPGPVKPRETYSRNLDLTFARCGEPDVDKTVDGVLDAFTRALAPAGPELSKATLLLSFFERRVSKSFWGFGSTEEKIVWEQWKIPFLVNHSALPLGEDEEAVLTRRRVQELAKEEMSQRLLSVFDIVNTSIDHVPPAMYEYEISCAGTAERRESMVSRLISTPSLLLNTT